MKTFLLLLIFGYEIHGFQYTGVRNTKDSTYDYFIEGVYVGSTEKPLDTLRPEKITYVVFDSLGNHINKRKL